MLNDVQAKEMQAKLAEESGQVASVFGALGDRSRFRMFRLLMEHKDLCVTDIATVLGITVPAASQQLKLLEGSGLIEPEREGQKVCYRIRRGDPVVKTVMRTVATLSET